MNIGCHEFEVASVWNEAVACKVLITGPKFFFCRLTYISSLSTNMFLPRMGSKFSSTEMSLLRNELKSVNKILRTRAGSRITRAGCRNLYQPTTFLVGYLL